MSKQDGGNDSGSFAAIYRSVRDRPIQTLGGLGLQQDVFRQPVVSAGSLWGVFFTLVMAALLIGYGVYLAAQDADRPDITSTQIVDGTSAYDPTKTLDHGGVMVPFTCEVDQCMVLTLTRRPDWCYQQGDDSDQPVDSIVLNRGESADVRLCYAPLGGSEGILFAGLPKSQMSEVLVNFDELIQNTGWDPSASAIYHGDDVPETQPEEKIGLGGYMMLTDYVEIDYLFGDQAAIGVWYKIPGGDKYKDNEIFVWKTNKPDDDSDAWYLKLTPELSTANSSESGGGGGGGGGGSSTSTSERNIKFKLGTDHDEVTYNIYQTLLTYDSTTGMPVHTFLQEDWVHFLISYSRGASIKLSINGYIVHSSPYKTENAMPTKIYLNIDNDKLAPTPSIPYDNFQIWNTYLSDQNATSNALMPDGLTCDKYCVNEAVTQAAGVPQCYPVEWECDLDADCLFSYDEKPGGYPLGGCPSDAPPIVGNCQESEFDCGTGQCIPSWYRCDNYYDCWNGVDEEGCPSCYYGICDSETLSCYDPDLQCNGIIDCSSPGDPGWEEQWCFNGELNDFTGEITCYDGYPWASNVNITDAIGCTRTYSYPGYNDTVFTYCIDAQYKCDGTEDCYDGNDEQNCDVVVECPYEDYSQCPGSTNCIPSVWMCDGINDCPGYTDEDPELCAVDSPCEDGFFSCYPKYETYGYTENPDGTVCFPESYQCDSWDDCVGDSDELNCGGDVGACANVLTCTDGQTVCNGYTCDGWIDCADESDEACGVPCYAQIIMGSSCDPTYCFQCEESTDPYGNPLCWSIDYQCDGFGDCPDGSDEPEDSCEALVGNCDPACQINGGVCVISTTGGADECECPDDRAGVVCELSLVLGELGGTNITKILGEDPDVPFTDRVTMLRTINKAEEPTEEVVRAFVEHGTLKAEKSLLDILTAACKGTKTCGSFDWDDTDVYGVIYLANPLVYVFTVEDGSLGWASIVSSTFAVQGLIISVLAIFVGHLNKNKPLYEFYGIKDPSADPPKPRGLVAEEHGTEMSATPTKEAAPEPNV